MLAAKETTKNQLLGCDLSQLLFELCFASSGIFVREDLFIQQIILSTLCYVTRYFLSLGSILEYLLWSWQCAEYALLWALYYLFSTKAV